MFSCLLSNVSTHQCNLCNESRLTLPNFISIYSLFISKFSTIPPTSNQPTNIGNLNNNIMLYDLYKNDCVLNNNKPNMHVCTSVNNALPLTHTPNYITHFGYYQNCRGLRTKLKTFICNASISNYIFICLSETWLCDNIYDNELGLNNYTVFRCDRNALTSSFSRGGGLLIAVRSEFDSNIIPITNSNVEHIFVKFTYNDSSYVVSSAYIPLNNSTLLYESYLSAIQSVINDNPNSLYLFSGDFNLLICLTSLGLMIILG